jgi:hypothetical protein
MQRPCEVLGDVLALDATGLAAEWVATVRAVGLSWDDGPNSVIR